MYKFTATISSTLVLVNAQTALTAMQEVHGFSLMLAPSAIDHPRAGIGVWLQGRAPAGAVVAFYPGIAYTKAHYRSAFALKFMYCIE